MHNTMRHMHSSGPLRSAGRTHVVVGSTYALNRTGLLYITYHRHQSHQQSTTRVLPVVNKICIIMLYFNNNNIIIIAYSSNEQVLASSSYPTILYCKQIAD
jgi:hypothetical protein